MAESAAFYLLDEKIQRFIWSEGWTELRDAQEMAIPPIIEAKKDVIISAATAAGKTEAAFLPALTHMLQRDEPSLIVAIFPLKALINDQFGRLDQLCEALEIPVWPWHGDVSASVKTKFMKERKGVLLITPESLEATLCNRGTSIAGIFDKLSFFIVDEIHSLIGSERGKQVQSLMHRIETVLGRSVPRIGLSATLGDIKLAAEYLRQKCADDVLIVESKPQGNNLKISVKGYQEILVKRKGAAQKPDFNEDGEAQEISKATDVALDLFNKVRGSNNLIFPNSRREVERYTSLLNQYCEEAKIPNEFWPHHGSLSKEIRSETEAALKRKNYPASAICTNTLELGIDIGAVKSVAQIGPPPSVASLRQRLGRSGRRKGESAILRAYCIENEIDERSSLHTRLRLETVQTTAMITLLLEGWFEPPTPNELHCSTLVQQLLSLIAQNGGIQAVTAYAILCSDKAPFNNVTKAEFIALLKHLGEIEFLMQDSSGLLLHGETGEKFVNHYSFYAAFTSDEEYKIVCAGNPLGTLPVSQMLIVGQRILFGGKTWVVESIVDTEKTIYVSHAKGGVPPVFSGGAGRIHGKVAGRMREVLRSTTDYVFLDETAKFLLKQGRDTYQINALDKIAYLDSGTDCIFFTWLGDDANEAISCFLISAGYKASAVPLGVEITNVDETGKDILAKLKTQVDEFQSDVDRLLEDAKNIERQKWDWTLPMSLLNRSYASSNLDIAAAANWITLQAAKI